MAMILRVTPYTTVTRRLFGVVAFALLLSRIASAAEPDWQFVTTSDDRIVYVDAATISMRENRLTASVLHRFSAQQTQLSGKSFLSSVYLVSFECGSERSGFVSVVNYAGNSGDGAVIDSFARSSGSVKLKYAEPRTLGHATLQYVCSRANAPGLANAGNLHSRVSLR
jgi:hypothetical protein